MNSSLIVEGNNLDTSMANMIQERLKLERVLRDRIERQGEWVKRYSDIPLIREQDVKVSCSNILINVP
jgi:hypothetical protein